MSAIDPPPAANMLQTLDRVLRGDYLRSEAFAAGRIEVPTSRFVRLAIVLGVTQTRSAFPALLDRYRNAYDVAQRAAPAEALGMLVGSGRAPRVNGSPQEIARDADALESWYREQLEIEAERAAGPPEGVAR